MKTSTAKRVVLYRFDRQSLEGIVNPASYLLEGGVELLSLDGAISAVPYTDLKALCFVSESGDPRLFADHNLFERRPRVPGLWTRFTFLDGDQLDGILPHNLLEWPAQGYIITPPHPTPLRQRIFVPRPALKRTDLHGVVGVSAIGRAPRKSEIPGQLGMFD